jgi:hypothetical protein
MPPHLGTAHALAATQKKTQLQVTGFISTLLRISEAQVEALYLDKAQPYQMMIKRKV